MVPGIPFPNEMCKWVRGGHHIEPATLAKNLTGVAALAVSATVLYFIFCNSKRPQYTDRNVQASIFDDEEPAYEDHTTSCKDRCRHSVIGTSVVGSVANRAVGTADDNNCMTFGCPLDEIQHSSSNRATQISSPVDVSMTNDWLNVETLTTVQGPNVPIQPSPTSIVSSFNALFDIKNVAAKWEDKCLTSFESALAQNRPLPTSRALTSDATNDVNKAVDTLEDRSLKSIESLLAQIQPSSSSIAPGAAPSSTLRSIGVSTQDQQFCPYIGNPCCPKFHSPSNIEVLSHSSRTGEQFCEAHAHAGLTTRTVHIHYDPGCARAQVDLLRPCKEDNTPSRTRAELHGFARNGTERMHPIVDDDDGGSHFEGYIYGVIRGKGSKSYKRRPHVEVESNVKEKGEGVDGRFSPKRLGSRGEVAGNRDRDAHTQTVGGQARERNGNGKAQPAFEEIRTVNSNSLLCQEGRVFSRSRPERISRRNSHTQTTAMAGEEERCDKGTCTSLDIFSHTSSREVGTVSPLKHAQTMIREEIHHLPENHSGVFERYAQERREDGIRSDPRETDKPPMETRSPLKALEETQHWSKMSLPQAYEYLELLDSTLAAASGESKELGSSQYFSELRFLPST